LSGTKLAVYTEDAQDWVITHMATKADAPKVKYTVDRLRKFMDDRGHELDQRARERLARQGKRVTIPEGKGARSEFVRTAIEDVAPVRNLQAWKSVSSGQQTLHSLLDKNVTGMTLWAMNLLNATMDHLEGLQWGIDETRKKPKDAPPAETPKEEPDFEEPKDGFNPPQEGPDQTTYDLAISLVDEYEEVFRKIAENAGADGTDPDDWKAVTQKAQAANLAVMDLRRDHDQALDELAKQEKANKELFELAEERRATELGENPVRGKYAETLLAMLTSYDGGKAKSDDGLLTAILERLDKLAGI